MRKLSFAALLISALIVSVAGIAIADEIPPGVFLSNVLKISGGNDPVFVRPFDNTDKYEDLYDENLSLMYPMITILSQNWTGKKPVKNAKPTKKDGLLNPDSPVEIVSIGNKLYIDEFSSGEAMRLLDSKGKEVFTISNTDNGKRRELKTTTEPKTYYIELSDTSTAYSGGPSIGIGPFSTSLGKLATTHKEYCYVMINVQSGRERRTYASTDEYKKTLNYMERGMAYSEIQQKYMEEHGIKDFDDMKLRDVDAIQKLFEEKYGTEADESLRPLPTRSYLEKSDARVKAVYKSYMKEHGITDIDDLTIKDMSIIAEEISKKTVTHSTVKSKKSSSKRSSSKKK